MESFAGIALLVVAFVMGAAAVFAFVVAFTTEVPPGDRKAPPHKWHQF